MNAIAWLGLLAGGVAVVAVALWCRWRSTPPDFFPAWVVELHGVPAGPVLGLLQRPPGTER